MIPRGALKSSPCLLEIVDKALFFRNIFFLLLQHKCTISCLDALLSSFTFIIRDIYMKTAFPFFALAALFPIAAALTAWREISTFPGNGEWGCQARGWPWGLSLLSTWGSCSVPELQRGCPSSPLALCSLWVHWGAGGIPPLPSTGIICTSQCETLEQAGILPGFPRVPRPG